MSEVRKKVCDKKIPLDKSHFITEVQMFINIIFDFDGVIINSHDIQKKALTESFNTFYVDRIPPYDEFFKLSGDSLKNIFTKLRLPLEMIPIYQKISRENINLIKMHEGMVDLLIKLNEKDCNCALCTGKDRVRTIEILKYYDIEKYFKVIVCSDDVMYPKPNPDSLFLIMKELNAKCENTVMVGDGINDILSAQNAGITSIAVTWGDISENELRCNNPDHICNSVNQLYSLLNEER